MQTLEIGSRYRYFDNNSYVEFTVKDDDGSCYTIIDNDANHPAWSHMTVISKNSYMAERCRKVDLQPVEGDTYMSMDGSHKVTISHLFIHQVGYSYTPDGGVYYCTVERFKQLFKPAPKKQGMDGTYAVLTSDGCAVGTYDTYEAAIEGIKGIKGRIALGPYYVFKAYGEVSIVPEQVKEIKY